MINNNDVVEILNNINKPTKLKQKQKQKKIYLTKSQYDKFNLIFDITKLDFINDMEKNLFLQILNKKKIVDNEIKNCDILKEKILTIKPKFLYKYISKYISTQYIKIIRNLIIPEKDFKCKFCNKISIKFNLCCDHYLIEKNNIHNIFIKCISANKKYFVLLLKIMEMEIIDIFKINDNYLPKENLELKINRINNLIGFTKKKNNIELQTIILNYIHLNDKNMRKYFDIPHKYMNLQIYQNLLDKINNFVKINNLKNLNENIDTNYEKLLVNKIKYNKLDNNITKLFIKNILNFIKRFQNFISKFMFFSKEIPMNYFLDNELTIQDDNDIKYNIIKLLYNLDYDIVNLTTNKYFDNNMYDDKNDLTFDIYGEIYNQYHKQYIPFVIIIKNIISKYNNIKKFYCFLYNISSFFYSKKNDNIKKYIEHISTDKYVYIDQS